MKISTGSSSSSVASDSLSRKSTLCIYTTEGDYVAVHEKPDCGSQAMELRRELDSVQRALHLQSETVLRQRYTMVQLTQKLATRDDRATLERELRESQLAAVLRSLYLLEARLKKEQTALETRLNHRDTVIQWQKEEILKLKSENNRVCMKCQKLFEDPLDTRISVKAKNNSNLMRSSSYSEKQGSTSFQKNCRLSKSFHLTKNGPECNTSSSEENNKHEKSSTKGNYVKNKQAFVRKDITRRSRKYSMRKHNSPYLDSIQKHSENPMDGSIENMPEYSEKHRNDTVFVSSSDDAISDKITQDIERASYRIDELLQRTNENQLNHIHSPNETYACKMESLHGIKPQTAKTGNFQSIDPENDNEKPWYMNTSDPEPESDFNYVTSKGKISQNRSKSTDNLLMEAYSEEILDKNAVSAKNEVICNGAAYSNKPAHAFITSSRSYNEKHASRQRTNNDKKTSNKCINNEKHVKFSNSGKFNDKFANETNENWYASASDHEDGPPCEIYKNNPVLECVNQILLQNSLDESSNEATTSPSNDSPKSNSKRVQFSTLNSISFDGNAGTSSLKKEYPQISERRSYNKIVKFSLETASEHSYEVPKTAEGFNYEVQSIYSNDYEPVITRCSDISARDVEKRPIPLPRSVGSGRNSSVVKCMAANLENKQDSLYFDTDANHSEGMVALKIVNRRKVPRTPPALPPKPKNLASKFKLEQQNNVDVHSINRHHITNPPVNTAPSSNSSMTEPDYCSISEINVPVVCGGKRDIILTQPSIEIHIEKQAPSKVHPQDNTIIAQVHSIPKTGKRISDKDIPKLPQVTEIIIPDEDDDSKDSDESLTRDPTENCITNTQLVFDNSLSKIDHRNSIQIGNSVSSILSELNRGAHTNDLSKKIALSELDGKYSDLLVTNNTVSGIHSKPAKADNALIETLVDEVEKFDLSQNFEEFKIDECEFDNLQAEEYKISSEGSDTSSADGNPEESNIYKNGLTKINSTISNYRIEFTADIDFKPPQQTDTKLLNECPKLNQKLTNKPDLLSNIDSVETDSVRNSDIESSNSSGSNSGSYNTIKYEPGALPKDVLLANDCANSVSFEYFLESSGLSSKSIVTPPKPVQQLIRPPNSNHKSVTKPKDVKARIRSSNTTNKQANTTAIKYFEPYL